MGWNKSLLRETKYLKRQRNIKNVCIVIPPEKRRTFVLEGWNYSSYNVCLPIPQANYYSDGQLSHFISCG